MMTHSILARMLLILLLAVTASGCEVIGDIFQAGLWVGLIFAVLAVALIMWIVGKVRS